MLSPKSFCFFFSVLFLFISPQNLWSQSATITEERRILKTYPFGDPDPVPILTDNTKIYPYHKFEGYAQEGQDQAHIVVTLENDYIKVFVLPEEGGKVWGAIEKSTGEEFIYRNEVAKFRNIAMRGPWTSGGIEFNFGIIGHTPATATPVDYLLETKEDGSVMCTVGNLDLSSRTQWRVQIILPPDKAYFETQALWYNPTPLQQSYYNWMTAAAEAREDLVFYTPGNQYLKHSGEALPYPIDKEGRNLSAYKNNNFGPAKSYHVVGEYNDFFGGYYTDKQFGFGHWALYEEMPGQKLWIWALSRSGGIWEDLLTDTDGQYIEWQAGRLFDQYSPGDHQNPQTQAPFPPNASDQWRELWFPVKDIGGLSDVSPDAVMHVQREGNQLTVGINALASASGTLQVKQADRVISEEQLNLQVMEVWSKTYELTSGHVDIVAPEMGLDYSSDPDRKRLKRPFQLHQTQNVSEVEQLYIKGMEWLKYREYDQAMEAFLTCLERDESNQRAMVALAELYYRRGQYQQALKYAHGALGLDTFNPHANYIAGTIYHAVGDEINALESLGWAARSMTYRSAAYAQMAGITFKQKDHRLAKAYANKSLDFNRYNINALQVLALLTRQAEEPGARQEALKAILEIDPLNHFAHYETYLMNPTAQNKEQWMDRVRSEFPYQTYLELGMEYLDKGLRKDALDLFALAPQHPVIDLWLAYLNQDNSEMVQTHLDAITEASPAFVFPYRRESLEVLEWANQIRDHWKLTSYLALNYWGKGRTEEATELMKACGNEPDYAPFYLARADLMKKSGGEELIQDLKKAHQLDPAEWRTWDALIRFHRSNNQHQEALYLSEEAYQRFPDNYSLGVSYAEALLHTGQHEACIKVLGNVQVLPFEHAYATRTVYEQAHILFALELINKKKYAKAQKILTKALEWPENIGVGKPYLPDERAQQLLLAYCSDQLKKKTNRQAYLDQVIQYTHQHASISSPNTLLGLLAMREANADGLQPLLDKIKTSDQEMHQWIIASFEHDQEAVQKWKDKASYTLQFDMLNRIADLFQ